MILYFINLCKYFIVNLLYLYELRNLSFDFLNLDVKIWRQILDEVLFFVFFEHSFLLILLRNKLQKFNYYIKIYINKNSYNFGKNKEKRLKILNITFNLL